MSVIQQGNTGPNGAFLHARWELARAMLIALLTLSLLRQVADRPHDVFMSIVLLVPLAGFCFRPRSRRSRGAVLVFSIGVATYHLGTLLQTGLGLGAARTCGCFGGGIPRWLELTFIVVFLAASVQYVQYSAWRS